MLPRRGMDPAVTWYAPRMRYTTPTLAIRLLTSFGSKIRHGPLADDAILWALDFAEAETEAGGVVLDKANDAQYSEDFEGLLRLLPQAGMELAKTMGPDGPVTADHLRRAHDWMRGESVKKLRKPSPFCIP